MNTPQETEANGQPSIHLFTAPDGETSASCHCCKSVFTSGDIMGVTSRNGGERVCLDCIQKERLDGRPVPPDGTMGVYIEPAHLPSRGGAYPPAEVQEKIAATIEGIQVAAFFEVLGEMIDEAESEQVHSRARLRRQRTPRVFDPRRRRDR